MFTDSPEGQTLSRIPLQEFLARCIDIGFPHPAITVTSDMTSIDRGSSPIPFDLPYNAWRREP